MIKYEKLRNYKSQQTVKSFIKRNIKKGNLKRFYTKNQFLILFLVFFLTLLILVIIPFFNISSDQTPATESAYPQLTIDKLVEEYSYGIGNSIAVDNYVRVDFSIFTNDTIEYYLTGENGYLSKIIRLKGPINNISEFSCLKSGKYQLIYYILEDHDEDGEAKIHIDLIRTPLKKFVIAPEVMPLIIFGIFSIFVKPTIYYQL